MAHTKKTWREKLDFSNGLPKVERIPPRMQKNFGKGTMTIPAPREVDAVMKRVKTGKLVTINRIREKIAADHGTTIACPITTGIFSWIAAHAAAEEQALGKKRVTPYWRTLKDGGVLNEKYPGGIDFIAKQLGSEGHQVVQKGKKWVVVDWEKKIIP